MTMLYNQPQSGTQKCNHNSRGGIRDEWGQINNEGSECIVGKWTKETMIIRIMFVDLMRIQCYLDSKNFQMDAYLGDG